MVPRALWLQQLGCKVPRICTACSVGLCGLGQTLALHYYRLAGPNQGEHPSPQFSDVRHAP